MYHFPYFCMCVYMVIIYVCKGVYTHTLTRRLYIYIYIYIYILSFSLCLEKCWDATALSPSPYVHTNTKTAAFDSLMQTQREADTRPSRLPRFLDRQARYCIKARQERLICVACQHTVMCIDCKAVTYIAHANIFLLSFFSFFSS